MARSADFHTTDAIGTGGPGFAPDFAWPSGRAEFGRARRGGNLTGPACRGFEKVTLGTASAHRRALFEREDSGSRGPHMLNCAFSGTYPEER